MIALESPPAVWDYRTAFARNQGLLTDAEQERLRTSCVAIAGLGGAGGVHLTTLLRLGVARFKIADLDTFDIANTNRQYGATSRTVGRTKVEVMTEVARAINPEVEITAFPRGLDRSNADAFFEGVDIALDGLDFFAPDARRLFFATARRHGVPAITCAPLGFGAALLWFAPGGMSFEDYFGIDEGTSREDQLIALAVGLAPRPLHLPYMDLSRIEVETGRCPSSSIGCQLVSGLAGTVALQVLLGRGGARPAPAYVQFDAYRQRLVRGVVRGGARNPLQRLKRWLFTRKLAKLGKLGRVS